MKEQTTERTYITLLKGAILLACTLSFWPYLVAAGVKGQTGDYSHVFVIPLIALVVYLRSKRAERSTARAIVVGILLVCGLLLRVVGEMQNWTLLSEVAFPFLFIGFVGLLFGQAEMRRVVFPAIFLMFSFGFVTDILLALFGKYLMLVSSGAAYDAVTTFIPSHGPYIITDNMIIIPPDIRFDVIEACAGIRGMLALFVIGSLLGYGAKLTWQQALRFVFLLAVVSLSINLVRIMATIIFSLLLQEHFSHQTVHDVMNWLVFGPLILCIPIIVRWARKPFSQIRFISSIAVVMIMVHVAQWHVRAAQGNTRVLLQQAQNQHVTIEIDQQSVPRAFLPYVSPEVNGQRHWRWVFTSSLVHSNISHLAVNVGLLLFLGYAIRRDMRWWWVATSLLAGQVAGTMTGWLTLDIPPGTKSVVFMGASCAISGLFGSYLILHLLRHRKWIQFLIFLAFYLGGMWLSTVCVSTSRNFSFTSHIAGLLAGVITAILCDLIMHADRQTNS